MVKQYITEDKSKPKVGNNLIDFCTKNNLSKNQIISIQIHPITTIDKSTYGSTYYSHISYIGYVFYNDNTNKLKIKKISNE